MVRDIDKYAAAGAKRLHRNSKYDIYTNEITELMQRGSRSVTDLYYAITNAYCMGVEAGARMTKRQQKRGAKDNGSSKEKRF